MSKSIQLVLGPNVLAAGFARALGITPALSARRSKNLHEMAQTVMPFDLNNTAHIFRMTDSSGVQSVVVKDTHDKDQIGLTGKPARNKARDELQPRALKRSAQSGEQNRPAGSPPLQ